MNTEPTIKILSQDLINKIAAGEVVERPASVVKELVENSLDAKGSAITIEVEQGGINLIRVIDNGCGMGKENARLSLVQHATSKINSADDLFNLHSMGFRGEALASIAAVSEFTLVTKNKDDLAGVQIIKRENQVTDSEIGCPVGTSVTVRNLFGTIPARKKYLKTAVTEFNHIVDLFLNYVMAHTEISWKLIHNGRAVYQYAATDDTKQRMFDVLGKEVASALLPVSYNGVEVKITGFVGKPSVARNNKKLQFLFVNDRPVHDYIVAKQVKDAFGSMLARDQYPVYILSIQLDPRQVDVNVHPRKTEVRFAEPKKVYSTTYRSIADVLDHNDLSVNPALEVPVNVGESESSNMAFRSQQMRSVPFKASSVAFSPKPASTFSGSSFDRSAAPFNTVPTPQQQSVLPPTQLETKSSWKIVGQIHKSYIVVESEKGYQLFDQHAVSERVQYGRVKKDWLADVRKQQALLIPATLELATIEANIVRLNMALFEKFGFELSELSNNSFLVNAVPQELSQKNITEIVKEMVGDIASWELAEVRAWEDGLTDSVDALLKMMACRSAVMFGDEMTHLEIEALLNAWQISENRYTCVHGRPALMEYSLEILEKLFKRKK